MKRASYFQTYKGRKKAGGGGGEFLRHKETGINNAVRRLPGYGFKEKKKERDKHHPSLCCLYYR